MNKTFLIGIFPMFFALTACAEPAKSADGKIVGTCSAPPCAIVNAKELTAIGQLLGDRIQKLNEAEAQIRTEGNTLNETILDLRKQVQDASPAQGSKK